ncbi:MAG: PHP domain-containing protein [Bacteroidales bacterium]|nr:PHP domain-containing protein [Bacteroidales bacterium]
MKTYRADLHIHTVLSPCGDLDMSPGKIIKKAKQQNLDIIGITDHNSTKHCSVTQRLGKKNRILVMMGAEVTTREEVHCLAFFEDIEKLSQFQEFIDVHLPSIKNKVDYFGHQVVVDENERILEEEERLLLTALDVGIDEIERKVHDLGGIFIPAHINRPKYSLMSQLGIVPPGLKAEAMEISKHIGVSEFLKKHQEFKDFGFGLIRSSDAHYLEHIGEVFTGFEMNSASFAEIRLALAGREGRKTIAV